VTTTTTVQEAYEAIRAHFSRPDAELARYRDDDGTMQCKYRTKSGAKCAIGCLISDELYNKLARESSFKLDKDFGRVEGIQNELKWRFDKGENGNLKELAGIIGYDDLPRFKFLKDAQTEHDMNADNVPMFIELLDDLAHSHGLQVVTQ
jgi:hypothetical protein